MDVKQVLRELVAVPRQQDLVLSLYLNTRWSDEHQRDLVRVFVQDQARRLLKSGAVFESMETAPNHDQQRRARAADRAAQSLLQVEDYMEGLLRQRHDDWATGLAIFCCAPTGLFRVLRTRVPFEPMEFFADRRPCVFPFLRTCATIPAVLYAAVDSEGGAIFETNCGVVEYETHIDRQFPGRHSQGGWSQRRYARHIDQLRERNLRSVAEPLTKIADALPSAVIVVSGQSGVLHAFEEWLPQRIRQRIVARVGDTSSGIGEKARAEILRHAQPLVEKVLFERRAAERDHTITVAAHKGLGVVGVADTLAALTQGRVHKLLIERDYHASWFKCSNCGAMAQSGEPCSNCGSTMAPVNIGEEMVRHALATEAEVEILPPKLPLPTGAGIAAQLRHRGGAAWTMALEAAPVTS